MGASVEARRMRPKTGRLTRISAAAPPLSLRSAQSARTHSGTCHKLRAHWAIERSRHRDRHGMSRRCQRRRRRRRRQGVFVFLSKHSASGDSHTAGMRIMNTMFVLDCIMLATVCARGQPLACSAASSAHSSRRGRSSQPKSRIEAGQRRETSFEELNFGAGSSNSI